MYLSLSHAHNREQLLYLLLLFLLPTQLGKHFWPEYSLVSGFRVDYLSPTLYLTDCVLGLLALHTVIFRGFSWVRTLRVHLIPISLSLLFLLITIIPAVSVWVGLYSLLKVVELALFAYFTSLYLRSASGIRHSVIVLGVTVCLESVLALVQVSAKGYLGGIFYFLGERAVTSLTPGAATAVLNGEVFLRAYATFSHPNVLAGFLVITMSYVYFNRAHLSFGWQKLLLGSTLVLGTVGLLVTLSRLAILVWAIVVLLILISRFRASVQRVGRSLPHRYLVLGGGSLVLLLLIGSLVLAPLLSSVMTRFSQSSVTEESVVVRRDLSMIALHISEVYPLLGVGLGNFIYTSVEQKRSADPLYFATQPVHNIFLLVTAETGILGLIVFLWCLFLAFGRAGKTAKTLLLMALFLGTFDHYFLTLQQGQLLFAFLLGYCFAGTSPSGSMRSS